MTDPARNRWGKRTAPVPPGKSARKAKPRPISENPGAALVLLRRARGHR